MSLSSAILNPEADSRRGEVGGVELWQVMVTEAMPPPLCLGLVGWGFRFGMMCGRFGVGSLEFMV